MRKLGVIALTVSGILVIFWGLQLSFQSLWFIPAMFEAGGGNIVSLLSLATSVVLVVLFGSALILKRNTLAERLFSETDADLSFDGISMLRVGLLLFGVYAAFSGTIDLLSSVSMWAFVRTEEAQWGIDLAQTTQQQWDLVSSFAIALIELGAGAVFVTRSGPISRRLWSTHEELPASEDPPSDSSCPSCGTGYDIADYRDPATARCTECGSPLFPGSA